MPAHILSPSQTWRTPAKASTNYVLLSKPREQEYRTEIVLPLSGFELDTWMAVKHPNCQTTREYIDIRLSV